MHATFLALLTVCAASGSCEAPNVAQDAAAFALAYGYPLLAFEKFARPQIQTSGVNQIRHARALSTAANTSVVTPNVDTLYSTAILDLSHDAVSIEPGKKITQGQESFDIPSDQFVLFSFYDPFGDNFANAGTGHPNNGKSWVVRQKPANVSSYGIQSSGQGQYFVNSPSAYTILLIRWLVNATNLDLVHTLQDQILVTNTSQAAGNQYPWLSSIQGVDKSKSPAANVLDLLAQYAPASNPTIASDTDTVRQKLRAAGVLSGNTTSVTLQSGVNIDKANQTALAAATSATLHATESVGNGWGTIQLNKTGNFGTDYNLRASIAAAGYLMLTAPDAIYPTWRNASDKSNSSSNIILSQGEALLYTFSAKPPLAQTGFWSLTLYNSDNFLVANERNAYGVGDRSNLTYADGTLVYGNASPSGEQKQFQVLIQPASVAPPTNWTANWLPAPEAGLGFHVVLRWYGAEGKLLSGGYEYPRVTRVEAVTKQTNGTNGGGSRSGAGTSGADRLSMNSLSLLLGIALFLAYRL
ncbi:hypothetical protein LEL_02048 [Akanthomyces lecanii RCEF 1005]|uniref:DUF1254 domain-containing protein n=1 Tax=Akanthomyces lecanii RCEF 1005 TaxID=1081108 RepID=A0A168KZK7_CORDF|nr:hypothetical protein LEL_02048 [Akanthomyces lecanii RCEF 1005]